MRNNRNQSRGVFIVIEGIDHTGKETQSKLLLRQLQKHHYKTAYFDFPQYGKRSCSFVEDYLAGEFGDATKFDPKISSLFYALDRFTAKNKIVNAIKEGRIVVSNRFIASNLAHQGTKLKTLKDKKNYWRWAIDFELNFLGLPEPKVTFILMLPLEVSIKLGKKRKGPKFISSSGTALKLDQHEGSIIHLKEARENYLLLAKLYPNQYKIINCLGKKRGTILPMGDIHRKIWKELQRLNLLESY